MHDDGLFSGNVENVMRWLRVMGVLLAAGAVALIAYVLSRKPEWRVTRAAKWTLLVGFFLLPCTTMLLGNVVGFHRVRQSCAECHTMDPWIADMKNPESKTLAARHYQNRWINEDQCYTCHTGYGLAGNLQAKIGGMKHVWHYYIGGVPSEIRIKQPFPVATCLHCHAETPGYRKIEQHVDPEFAPKIAGGQMSCFECHEAPHPRNPK